MNSWIAFKVLAAVVGLGASVAVAQEPPAARIPLVPSEISLHAMSKREVWIGFQHSGETGGRIDSVGEVAGDEMIVRSDSLGAGGREGEAAGIEMHGVAPSRHFPYTRPIRAATT